MASIDLSSSDHRMFNLVHRLRPQDTDSKKQRLAETTRRRRRNRSDRALKIENLEPRQMLAANPFTPGDVVVYRVGDSTTPAGNSAATTVYLDEYTPTGTLVQSVELSNSSANGAIAFTDSGKAGSAGQISLSPDGKEIAMFGYNANVGTASVTSSTVRAPSVSLGPTVFLRRGFSNTAVEAANNARTSVYDDSTGNLYLGGKLGVNYTGSFSNGTTNANATLIGNASISSLEIFNNQLFYASGTSIFAFGSGEPTANATATALTFGNGTPTAVEAFYFTRLGNGASFDGYDTLYLIDQGGNNTSGGSIDKFFYNGTNWISDGTITGADGANATLNGLTASVNANGSVSLYASAGSIGNAESGHTGGRYLRARRFDGRRWRISGNVTTPGSGVTSSNPVHLGSTSLENFRGIVLAPDDGIQNTAAYSSGARLNYTKGNAAISPASRRNFRGCIELRRR